MTPDILAGLRVIDTDSHVTEPANTWTARMAGRFGDDVPCVQTHPDTGIARWRVGERWLTPVGAYARSGWRQFPPEPPRDYDETDPGTWRAPDRLARMDEYGIWAQVLHPNLLVQDTATFLSVGAEFATACVRAYNDFVIDFAAADPRRLLPVAMLPFWDLDASVAEVHRAAATGHHGVLFGNDHSDFGLPDPIAEHWHPIYAAAQHADLPIITHVGFGERAERPARSSYEPRRAARESSVALLERNARMIARVVTSGLLDTFPRLTVISAESGAGYVPYLLESLDWNWKVHGMHRSSALLPSEYFRRNCLATFWFERDALRLLDTYPDNFMFQTDYPHQNALAPGPVSPAELPSAYLARVFAGIDDTLVRKVVQDNAARVYGARIE